MKNKVIESFVACIIGMKTILRPVNIETDFESMLRWINDPQVNRFLKARGPITILQEREYVEKIGKDPSNIIFAIETREDHRLIGTMGIHNIDYPSGNATTGSLIGEKDCWGKGYGTDAKMLLLNYAFNTLNLRRINSSTIAYNERSSRCLQRCGYQLEGILKEYYYREGKYWDRNLFRIFRPEFEPLWEKYSAELQKFNETQK